MTYSMHKCKIFWPVLLLTPIISSALLPAATIISVTGPSDNALLLEQALNGTGQIVAVSWTSANSYANVSIAVTLDGNPSNGGIAFMGTAYLMNQLGPGTTTGNQLATSSFSDPGTFGSVALFSNLTLGAGTYYLLLAPAPGPQGLWASTNSPILSTDPGVSQNSFLYTHFAPPLAAYLPASAFVLSTPGDSSPKFQVSGTAIPEPSMAGLAGIALLVMLSLKAGGHPRTRT